MDEQTINLGIHKEWHKMSWENENINHSPETCGDLGDAPNPNHD